jgi:hypothetical protein
MIAYSYIERNLQSFEVRYTRAKSNREMSYFSKLATLELCGWIETSIDDCVERCAIRVLKERRSVEKVEQRVKKTYGFHYDQHFTSLLITLVGVYGLERIEGSIPTSIVQNFRSTLGTLKAARDALAHTYTRGTTANYDAPSLTWSRYQHVKKGLAEYDRVLRQMY